MSSAADSAWLIPVLPLVGGLITGLGLISFNRTINRLRKPVAVLLISCIGAAAVLSYAVLADQIAGASSVEHLFVWASAGTFTSLLLFKCACVSNQRADAWIKQLFFNSE